MRAVAYLRVSTDEQSASGAGLHAQLDACRAHASRLGWDLAGPFADEAVSGAAPLDRRPAMIDALAELGPGDVLLVAKRDRLGRDPIAVAMIEAAVARKGGRVVSAAGEGTDGDDPTSILMRRMVDAFAEYERLVIKARTRAALQAKRRRGERTGGIPFGHDLAEDGIALVENPRELEALVVIRRLKAEGLSLRGIAAELDRLGIPPKQGGPAWKHTAVKKLLQRPT
jgi:DNA invertase Pin-like site-specific DNA recombinase